MMKTTKLIAGLLLTLCCSATYCKELGQVTNKLGGLTILTDITCPVSDDHLYGMATGKDIPVTTFCWTVKGDDVVLYLPLDKSIKININEFEKPNKTKDVKPFVAI